MASDPINAKNARRIWSGYPDTRKIVLHLLQLGWRIVPSGRHNYRARCPEGYPLRGHGVAISKTPQNDGRHARRVSDETLGRCPDRHDLMR